MARVRTTHVFDEMTEDMRPQDERMDGSDLTFITTEHGGEFPDQMPQVVTVVDPQGRWCRYHPVTVDGKVVQSHHFGLEHLHGQNDAIRSRPPFTNRGTGNRPS